MRNGVKKLLTELLAKKKTKNGIGWLEFEIEDTDQSNGTAIRSIYPPSGRRASIASVKQSSHIHSNQDYTEFIKVICYHRQLTACLIFTSKERVGILMYYLLYLLETESNDLDKIKLKGNEFKDLHHVFKESI
jgi:hypothetical protein